MSLTKVTYSMIEGTPLNVLDFGAVGDGIVDDTNAIKAALNAAKGGAVYVPKGKYRITSNLDNGVSYEIRLIGESSAFSSHSLINAAVYQNSNNFTTASIENYATLGERYSVIVCDNCNMLGAPDTASTNECDTARQISNLCIIGTNGAQIGLYVSPIDALFENCAIALFEKFGVCIRGGITSTFRKMSFNDNGWNLAESGSATYPATYVSGCQINIVSNFIANDFATVVGVDATTTMSFENHYYNVRGWSQINQSGYRGLQVHYVRGLNLNDIGSYSGLYFYIALASGNNVYVENYATHGLTAASVDPHAIYSYFSALSLNTPVLSMNSVPTQEALYVRADSEVFSSTAAVSNNGKFNQVDAGALTSRYDTTITVDAPGSTVTYPVLPNTLPDVYGFHGFAVVSITKASDYTQYAVATYLVHKHTAGVSGNQITTPVLINEVHTPTGGFLATITTVSFTNTGAVTFGVTWGASYSASDEWIVNIGLFGAAVVSAPAP